MVDSVPALLFLRSWVTRAFHRDASCQGWWKWRSREVGKQCIPLKWEGKSVSGFSALEEGGKKRGWLKMNFPMTWPVWSSDHVPMPHASELYRNLQPWLNKTWRRKSSSAGGSYCKFTPYPLLVLLDCDLIIFFALNSTVFVEILSFFSQWGTSDCMFFKTI